MIDEVWWPWFESHKRHIPFQGTALLLSYKASVLVAINII